MTLNPWLILLAAGLFEIVWAVTMKASDGFTRITPSIATWAAAFVSFWLLSMAMKDLPLGTAYTVWMGIGAVGAAIMGVALFGEAVTPLRLCGIALIILGMGALKLSAS
jgi:quaternary ammonium compound-resistance protein SugE